MQTAVSDLLAAAETWPGSAEAHVATILAAIFDHVAPHWQAADSSSPQRRTIHSAVPTAQLQAIPPHLESADLRSGDSLAPLSDLEPAALRSTSGSHDHARPSHSPAAHLAPGRRQQHRASASDLSQAPAGLGSGLLAARSIDRSAGSSVAWADKSQTAAHQLSTASSGPQPALRSPPSDDIGIRFISLVTPALMTSEA